MPLQVQILRNAMQILEGSAARLENRTIHLQADLSGERFKQEGSSEHYSARNLRRSRLAMWGWLRPSLSSSPSPETSRTNNLVKRWTRASNKRVKQPVATLSTAPDTKSDVCSTQKLLLPLSGHLWNCLHEDLVCFQGALNIGQDLCRTLSCLSKQMASILE